jgi:D-xylose transport system ATP-binding protein
LREEIWYKRGIREMNSDLLRMEHITKVFPGVRALEDVSFSARKGLIHAIVGENGAGKSTLMKILSGVYPYGTYEGRIVIQDSELQLHSIHDAQQQGIALIPQELNLCSHVSVAENMFLSRLPKAGGIVDWKYLYGETQRMIEEFDIGVLPTTPVARLRAGQQQLVLLARAILQNPKILILDEPTSSLTSTETELLFGHLRRFREEGMLSIYISHRLDEVAAIADQVTVMRDGRIIGSGDIQDFSRNDIVQMMVGREITEMYPRQERKIGDVVLEVQDMTLHDPLVEEKLVVNNVSFSLRAGEIAGMYGLMGAGRTELVMGIFGAWPGARSGNVSVWGKPVEIDSPRAAMNLGIGLLTEDRKQLGLFLDKSVMMNLTIANLLPLSRNGVINEESEKKTAKKYSAQLSIKTPSVDTVVENLSGGNQQKVIVGRWLAAESKIMLLDEPTKGIDVGAKREMFDLLNKLAAEGNAVLFISSELPEVLGVSDRILVMTEGKLVADLDWRGATSESVMHYATGGM